MMETISMLIQNSLTLTLLLIVLAGVAFYCIPALIAMNNFSHPSCIKSEAERMREQRRRP